MARSVLDDPLYYPVLSDPVVSRWKSQAVSDRELGKMADRSDLREWRGAAAIGGRRDIRAVLRNPVEQPIAEQGLPGLFARVDSLEREVTSLTGSLAILRREFANRPTVRQYQLFDLNSALFDLVTPLIIIVEEYRGDFVARFPEVEAVGACASEGGAVEKLKADIVNLYRDLREEPAENLDETTRRWLYVLNKVIKPID